jgi:hypothetical protein
MPSPALPPMFLQPGRSARRFCPQQCILTIPAPTNTPNRKTPANFLIQDRQAWPACLRHLPALLRPIGNLNRRKLTHTKEKPFECPECTRCFPRLDLLQRHQQNLHQILTPSSHPRSRHDSATNVGPGQSRARKNSFAGPNRAASNALATSMRPLRPRANTMTHADGSAVQMTAAAKASAIRDIPATHTHS